MKHEYSQLDELDDMISSDDSHLRCQAAKAPLLTVQDMIKLGTGECHQAQKAIASRPDLPQKVIRAIVRSDPVLEVVSLALRGYKGHKLFRELARSSDNYTRRLAAKHPNTEDHVLRELAYDNREDVRCAVASRSRIPVHVQKILSRDPSVSVRKELAQNDDISLDVLLVLKEDIDSGVRKILEDS